MEINEPRTSFIKIGKVSERVGLSRAQIYKMMANGDFPRQINLTSRSVAWTENEIDAWIASRCAARNESGSRFKLSLISRLETYR
jgi:prophage regulatory protein